MEHEEMGRNQRRPTNHGCPRGSSGAGRAITEIRRFRGGNSYVVDRKVSDRKRKGVLSLGRKATAEFMGTFWLVFGGCGSAVLAAAFPSLGIGFVGVALAFGLTVLTMAYAIGRS